MTIDTMNPIIDNNNNVSFDKIYKDNEVSRIGEVSEEYEETCFTSFCKLSCKTICLAIGFICGIILGLIVTLAIIS